MNSFRVVDTKFRILKGGKIGLSLSIALMAGMLMFGSTKAAATDYFTGVTTNTSGTASVTDGAFDITVQTAINSSPLTTTDIRITFAGDDVDSIVIKPDSWATSYYAPTFDSDYNAVPADLTADYSIYNLNKTNSPLVLNLTFAVSANSADITKNAATLYSAPLSGSVDVDGSTLPYTLIDTVSSAYTANLIFNGSNIVSGDTAIDDGTILIEGNDVTFEKSIQAGSIDINSSGLANLNTISGATTSNIVFSGNGTANLYGDLTGNVTTANNQGTLTIIGSSGGKAQTINGDIGTSNLLDLSTLNIGETGLPSTNYTVTTINGNVYANSTVLNNGAASSELILASGKNITSAISTADANMGILTLEGGAQTVTGQVGTDTDRLEQVNSGADGATSTFVNDVYAVNVTNTGTGTTNFQNDVKATNVNVNAGTTNFEDNLTATTTTITTGTGKFNTVSGATSSDIVFTDIGTANLYGNLTGNVTTDDDNQGTLTIIGSSGGKAQTINGDIGTSDLLDLSTLNIGESGVSTNYTVTTINGNVYANSTVLYNGTTASSELILASGKSITSTITTADDGKGILTLVGGTQTVDGTVGAGGAKLAEINTGNGTTTFSSNVFATNLDLEGTGTVNLNGNYEGTALNYNADGIVNLADGKNITSAIISDGPNQGTLNLAGTSIVSGLVGDTTNNLKEINANGNAGKVVTFSSNVYATNLDLEGTGTVNLNGNYEGTALNYNADGIVNLADGKNITSAIISDGPNQGTLNLAGTSIVSGLVGDTTNNLKEINVNGNAGKVVTFSSNVYATNLDLEGTGTVNLNGNYEGIALKYNADGIVNLADGKNITSAIISDGPNQGTLNLAGTSIVSGWISWRYNK